MNFFLVGMGCPKPFIEWGNELLEKKLAQMTDEEKDLVNSYLNDIHGESYEPLCRLLGQIMFNAPCLRLSEE